MVVVCVVMGRAKSIHFKTRARELNTREPGWRGRPRRRGGMDYECGDRRGWNGRPHSNVAACIIVLYTPPSNRAILFRMLPSTR